ncbi:hypothetical protein [Cytobacillus firmus]|uniref:hypothetical protein n=1 Tax=Cytobacillus firmus TaxID=1399 RepID=UPI001C8DBAB0|nr:hypothetical protein [Cytobacillus firmus]MBX9975400.1 hypothetical protein [Cytobacillus firmus]MDM5227058.1 hypothetical protein [Cytobacillus sp. NJ13]
MTHIEDNERKKISLKEAMKQQLMNKKQEQSGGKFNKAPVKSAKALKSQQTKKTNNQRKRTGV